MVIYSEAQDFTLKVLDAVLLNIVNDVPVVTRYWTMGCIAVSALVRFNMINSIKMLYSYEIVFQKGHYERILYSLFDYGLFNWMSLMNIVIAANHLSFLENSFSLKRRYVWILFLTLCSLLGMSYFGQPVASLGVLLQENLSYYYLKKNNEQMNIRLFGNIAVSPLLVPFYLNCLLLFVYHMDVVEVAMFFLPGHIMFYMDDMLKRIYGVDLTKTPYDWWLGLKETQ